MASMRSGELFLWGWFFFFQTQDGDIRQTYLRVLKSLARISIYWSHINTYRVSGLWATVPLMADGIGPPRLFCP